MTTNAQIASGNACQFFIAQYPRSFQQIALLQKNRNALIRPAIGIGNTFQRRQVNDQYRIDNVMPNPRLIDWQGAGPDRGFPAPQCLLNLLKNYDMIHIIHEITESTI